MPPKAVSPEPEAPKVIVKRVRAISVGYGGLPSHRYREPGAEFQMEINPSLTPPSWVEFLDDGEG